MATTSLLQIKSTVYGFLGELWQGVATGGASGAGGLSLIDTSLIGYTSETWPTKLEGVQVRVTSGATTGDLRMVGRVDRSEGTLIPNRNFTAAVANTDTYELWGTTIQGGAVLSTLINDVLRGLRPVTDTQVTVVTNQSQYDVTTVVQTKREIHSVYLRLLDPSGAVPYTIYELRRGLEWDAYDRGGGGTTSVFLNLFQSRTLAAAAEQLWIRAETGFTPFSTSVDTGTVDAVYRDWIALETVLALAGRRLAQGTSDKARWLGLRDWVLDSRGGDLLGERARWCPREPVMLATFP